ncbi:hypothetical protein [Frankia sp. EI5c]|uniref:hypothetical protein n=1 Tax=Frankia sp. EI5c TaxID=683316 RepID=UPI001A7EB82D|nr:hypothetical protein [Frankia sp. EI5c]
MDLDSATPDWGSLEKANNAIHDIITTTSGGKANAVGASGLALLGGQDGDYETCRSQTYVKSPVALVDLAVGTNICVFTSERRYALLVAQAHGRLGTTFRVTVWGSEAAPAQPAPNATVRNTGDVALNLAGARLNLDSTAPAWGAPGVAVTDMDINTSRNVIYGTETSQLAILEGERGDYETCRSQTTWTRNIKLEEVGAGTKICVYTTEKRFALMVAQEPGAPITRFSITTWG